MNKRGESTCSCLLEKKDNRLPENIDYRIALSRFLLSSGGTVFCCSPVRKVLRRTVVVQAIDMRRATCNFLEFWAVRKKKTRTIIVLSTMCSPPQCPAEIRDQPVTSIGWSKTRCPMKSKNTSCRTRASYHLYVTLEQLKSTYFCSILRLKTKT